MNPSSSVTRTMRVAIFLLAAFGFGAAYADSVTNVVLVHGYFADGSGWAKVAELLTRDGYSVSVVQEPETSFADDVKATKRVVDAQNGPTILVGHSYGGAVITEAGNDEKVAALVYVAAFQPDTGESALDLVKKMPPATNGIKATADGYLYIDQAEFHADFCADLPAKEAKFMGMSQVMPAAAGFGTPISNAAWKSKPSWAIVATDDKAINPDLERFMYKRAGSTTVEVKSSHVAYISHPSEVTKLIEEAAAHAIK